MVRDGRQEEERGEIGETNAAKESCAQSEFVCYTMAMLYQCNGYRPREVQAPDYDAQEEDESHVENGRLGIRIQPLPSRVAPGPLFSAS